MRIKPALLLAALATCSSVFGSPIPVGASCKAVDKSVAATTVSVCNANPINMPAAGPASLYPSTINVNGVSGVISDLNIRLLGVTHSNTSTLNLLLSPPSGDPIGVNGSTFNMANPNSPDPPIILPTASSANWTFDDSAEDYALVASTSPSGTTITAPTASGSYRPRLFTSPLFDVPAPTTTRSQLLSSQIGRSANGAWSLFAQQAVLDNATNPQATGTIASGWCLDIETTPATSGCYERTVLTGAVTLADFTQEGRINRDGVVGLCGHQKGNSLFGTTVVHRDAYAIVNSASHRTCVTTTADFTGCGGTTTHIAIYDSYDSNFPGNNVKADSGYSATAHLQNSFAMEAGESATIVISMIAADAQCPAYTIWLEQNACNTEALPSLFGDGFEDP